MSEEQLRLMARLIIDFYATADYAVPYNSWGVNVGQCRYCGAVGVVHYPDIHYDHTPECPMTLAKQLHQSLQTEEQKA